MTTTGRPDRSASTQHNTGGKLVHACRTCGAVCRHRYCSAHDPAQADRRRDHEERARRYRERFTQGPRP